MVYMSLSCTLRGSFYKGKTDILLFTLEIFTVENQANILMAFSKRYRGRYQKHRENTFLRTVCLSHTRVLSHSTGMEKAEQLQLLLCWHDWFALVSTSSRTLVQKYVFKDVPKKQKATQICSSFASLWARQRCIYKDKSSFFLKELLDHKEQMPRKQQSWRVKECDYWSLTTYHEQRLIHNCQQVGMTSREVEETLTRKLSR